MDNIEIAGYTFEGPYKTTNKLKNKSGVYAIHDKRINNYYPLDVGESAKVKERVENHDRSNCWKRNANGDIYVSVHYTPNKHQAGRMKIEQTIRNRFDYPCGDK